MNLNTLVLAKQMGTGHSGKYKKIHFHIGFVGIFVIISVLLPFPSETENVKRKTISANDGQIFTGRITCLGGFGREDLWLFGMTLRPHVTVANTVKRSCFPLHQELIYL